MKSVALSHESLAEKLQKESTNRPPEDWTVFRSRELLFELWHPPRWIVEGGDHLILKPSFAKTVWEDGTKPLCTPSVTLLVGIGKTEENSEEQLSLFGDALGCDFRQFRMIGEERLIFRGCNAACYRFNFERAASVWEAAMLCVPAFGKLFILDASGTTADVCQHRDVLERVIASLEVFPDSDAFEASRTSVRRSVRVERNATTNPDEFINAVRAQDIETVETLIQAGVDPNIRAVSSSPALVYAANDGDVRIVEMLIKAGADPNCRGIHGGTPPLCFAVNQGHAEIVKALLRAGADPNMQCDDGTTCLLQAVGWGNVGLVKLLLESGAKPDIPRCGDGMTPLRLAKEELEIESERAAGGLGPRASDDGRSYGDKDARQHVFEMVSGPVGKQ